ncbi:hypothetical protein BS78_02G329400 [Paspalum vaginatum]|nr:hypothetical protein BS78_02G329400 [Paspalum vaginatum]
MGIDECRKLLLNKALQIDAPNAQRFIDYIVKYKLPEEIIRYSSGSIQQVRALFHEVMTSLEARSPQFQHLQQPHLLGLGLQFPQHQLHPNIGFPGHQVPQFDPSIYIAQPPFLPFSQIVQLYHVQPQFYLSGRFYGNQPQSPLIGQIERSLPQYRPSAIFNGIQHPSPSTVLMGAHGNSSQDVTEYLQRWSKRCYDHFTYGGCRNGKNCHYCHWYFFYGMPYEKPNHFLVTLPALGKEIRQLLISKQPSVVPVECLPVIYFEKYGKSLFVKDLWLEEQEQRNSLICLFMRLDTIKVIERDGQHYVVLGEASLECFLLQLQGLKLKSVSPSLVRAHSLSKMFGTTSGSLGLSFMCKFNVGCQ